MDYLDPTSINGLNLYANCNNDPLNFYDPNGNSLILILTSLTLLDCIAIAAVIVIVVAAIAICVNGGLKNVSFDLPFETTNTIFSDYSEIKNCDISIENSSLTMRNEYQITSVQDPYDRPGQKKQGRELKNKARGRFKTKPKFRRGRKEPKHHTPGREHRKYIVWLLWELLKGDEDE